MCSGAAAFWLVPESVASRTLIPCSYAAVINRLLLIIMSMVPYHGFISPTIIWWQIETVFISLRQYLKSILLLLPGKGKLVLA